MVQLSTLGALASGLYDGLMPVHQMARYGDLGLGTFHALDGEMVQIDGKVFQVLFDGSVRKVRSDAMSPFFTTTFFEADDSFAVQDGTSLQALHELLDRRLPSRNLFYAVRIDGSFRRVRTRSFPRQSRPYAPLSQVTPGQALFDLEEVRGTAVGFRTPGYAAGLNAAGYHLHFLDEKRSRGGHVLDLQVHDAVVRVDYTPRVEILLPEDDPAWTSADIPRDPA